MDALSTARTIALVSKIVQPLIDNGSLISTPSIYADYIMLDADFFHDAFEEYKVEELDNGKKLTAKMYGCEFVAYEEESLVREG